MEAFLPVIFLIHLVVFVSLAIKRKNPHYWFFGFGFLLLIIKGVLQQYWPNLEMGGFVLYDIIRVSAWIILGTISVVFLANKKL